MNNLQEYVKQMQQPLEPLAKEFVDRVLDQKHNIKTKTFIAPTQPSALLKNEKPFFRFVFRTNAGEVSVDQLWSERIESVFFSAGIKLDDKISESLRCGTLLLSNMQWPDIQFGRSLTDTAIIDVISNRFKGVPVIDQVLQTIPEPNFSNTRHDLYQDCKNFVKLCIDGLGNSLVMQLHYEDREAYPILLAVVCYFLDVRFSVTLKKAILSLRS